jgi:transposase
MTIAADALPDDPGTLKAMLIAERAQNDRLRQIIKELQRHRFGRRAETLPEDQMLLGLEDVEQDAAGDEAKIDAANPAERASRSAKRRLKRGSLPAHLARIEMVIDIDDQACPCCGKALHRIGEDTGERLDIVPAQFRVLVVRRPKYACRACENVVVQAPAPARLIEGGLPTEATVAEVLVSKYADHLPLYRQAQIYARQGVDLDRSTLADWVGRAGFMLRPVHERLLTALKASAKLFADETTAPVLDPGRGRTKTGQLWAYARDDRPWAAPIHRASPTCTRPIAKPRSQSLTSPASPASCRSTAMRGIECSPGATMCSLPSAGLMFAAGFANSLPRGRRRLPLKHSNASPTSTPSRSTSAAVTLMSAAPSARTGAGRSLMAWNLGFAPSSP